MQLYQEGIIKFTVEHRREPLPSSRYGQLACKLIAWREILFQTGLVGKDPGRYCGAGYGNISGRVGAPSCARGRRAFLITGTQTGAKASLALDDLCVVSHCDYRLNRVQSQGMIEPSSESMTHEAIYDLSPQIRFVFHGHSPLIWLQARRLRLPTTDPHVAYGTPEMASEVQRLYRSSALPELQICAMGGHEDGVVVFGRTAEETGQVLLVTLARAYEGQCQLGQSRGRGIGFGDLF